VLKLIINFRTLVIGSEASAGSGNQQPPWPESKNQKPIYFCLQKQQSLRNEPKIKRRACQWNQKL
ncbi:MAG: hypothetical protein WB217_05065, partial [Mesobacillus sp.]|uniref:hypothetical protein n=1 Tax=Mesobacillus sp. TaxID=2675271 RepID=UPI003C3C53D4